MRGTLAQQFFHKHAYCRSLQAFDNNERKVPKQKQRHHRFGKDGNVNFQVPDSSIKSVHGIWIQRFNKPSHKTVLPIDNEISHLNLIASTLSRNTINSKEPSQAKP